MTVILAKGGGISAVCDCRVGLEGCLVIECEVS